MAKKNGSKGKTSKSKGTAHIDVPLGFVSTPMPVRKAGHHQAQGRDPR